MQDFEKLGAFYLGRLQREESDEEILLYDAKDLTTHAVCVGMTGSGKTGLGIGLIEEAAIDGIPAIVVDPKGDMGNLLLNFPNLAPSDFRPWIDQSEAARKGREPDEHAKSVAEMWRNGLAEWGQGPDRIRRLADAVEMTIYTPGSTAGVPISVLKSFDAPPAAVLEDAELFGDRVQAAVAGLLALLGIDADPIQSRESILLSNIVHRAWVKGESLALADLIRAIQDPPFTRLGVLDLETFYPAKDRASLAMSLNNLLASPGFASWLEGEALNVHNLLYTESGKPRISILSIAHLSESERMFFVTILLNEVLAWVRSQPGTGSLRALLYMDEIFGYFPPTKEPPSKKPMLTLLKQARAYGFGVILSTQNPVDLDYKGLSNTGTWFIGRLQTERDKLRVLDGLEGAMTTSGQGFDRSKLDATLSGLGKRVFLMNNVHEDGPVLFRTRWVLSYLRGPLTRDNIRALMRDRQTVPTASAGAATTASVRPKQVATAKTTKETERPLVPSDIEERFVDFEGELDDGEHVIYRPLLGATARLHFTNASLNIDRWDRYTILSEYPDDGDDIDWEEASAKKGGELDLRKKPEPDSVFGSLPASATNEKNYRSWSKYLKSHLYSEERMTFYKCKRLKLTSKPDETEGEFRVRVNDAVHEKRDLEIEKLKKRYASKFAALKERIRKGEAKIDKEEQQYESTKTSTWTRVGSLLGALVGRKSSGSKAGTAARSASRAAKEKGDVRRAKDDLEALEEKLEALEAEFESDLEEVREEIAPEGYELEERVLAPRKSDIEVSDLQLVWTPWKVDADGLGKPAF